MSSLTEIASIVGLEIEIPEDLSQRASVGLLFREAPRIGIRPTGNPTGGNGNINLGGLGRFIVLWLVADAFDLFLNTDVATALERVASEQAEDTETETEQALNDCMIEGQEIPGRGSKIASEVLEKWNERGSEISDKLDELLGDRSFTITPSRGPRNFNFLITLYAIAFAALMNCIEAEIEPSIQCFNPSVEPCQTRRRVPSMVRRCIRTDSTG